MRNQTLLYNYTFSRYRAFYKPQLTLMLNAHPTPPKKRKKKCQKKIKFEIS